MIPCKEREKKHTGKHNYSNIERSERTRWSIQMLRELGEIDHVVAG